MTTAADQLAAIILAAGSGTRLRPLTDLLPKALCPVANRPLVDWALDAVSPYADRIAVNVHAHRPAMLAHLEPLAVQVSVEEVALGTAGAVGNLRSWVDGAPVLVANADAWRDDSSLDDLVDGWDGERVRLLCVEDPDRGDFGRFRYAGACLLPWTAVRELSAEPTGLYEVLWRAEEQAGRLDLAVTTAEFLDCGTPRDYLRANLAASGGASVIGAGAVVDGEVVRSVVWAGARIAAHERLVEAIRAGDHTVQTASGQTR